MLRMTRNFAGSIVLIAGAALAAPSANAWPLGKVLHFHPSTATKDSRINFQLVNKGHLFQDVNVAGKVYTIMPQQTFTIKAPAGTDVYAASTGIGHRKGELLFEITPQMKGATVSID
ncbi:MAG: hypothetical protein M3O31_02460 [Acidobacteriota bacterium]|nr:hypothetical protein [Acidobacteriota bacterium]